MDQGQCAETQRHEGDLILAGDETLLINDCILEVTGGIYVRDNASLRLENVDLRFVDTDEDLRHIFQANGKSTIVLSNVRCRFAIQVYDAASLYVLNSTLYRSWYCTLHKYNHTGGGAYAYQDAQLTLSNSKVGSIVTGVNATAEITGSAVSRVSPYGGEVTIIESTVETLWETVEGIKGALSLATDDFKNADPGSLILGSRTAFRNAQVKEVWLSLIDSDITLTDSRLGYIYVYNGSRLAVKNSSIAGLGVYEDSEISVEGSDIGLVQSIGVGNKLTLMTSSSQINKMVLEFNNVDLEAEECTIEHLVIDNSWANTVEMKIYNSVVGHFTPGFGENAPILYQFNNATIRDSMSFRYGAYSDAGGALFEGSIHFGPEFLLNHTTIDRYAMITRLYKVLVTEGSAPKEGVKLTLLKGDRIVWSGETDAEGAATFPAKYARIFLVERPTTPITPTVIQVNNVTDTLTLRVGDDRSTVELKVGLATNTPIMVNVARSYEYGLYALPLILVVIVLYLIRVFRQRSLNG